MTRPLRLTDDAPGALAALAVPAPVHVPEHVLVEVGLADRMAPIASPSGPCGSPGTAGA